MTTQIWIFIAIIVILQLLIGHFLHDIGFSLLSSILLMLLPFGIGVFILQLSYYERYFPEWDVPAREKIRLEIIYLATFLEFVALYLFLFIF